MANVKCGIYGIACRATGKLYVGSSTHIHQRWYQHRRNLLSSKHSNRHLQNAWNKHTESAFYFSIIEECGRDVLVLREQYYVDMLSPAFNRALVVKAPRLGHKNSPEHNAKIAAAHRGMKLSPETVEKMRRSKLGKPSWNKGIASLSPEHLKKMLDARLGKPNSFAGKRHSEETRARMRAAQAKRTDVRIGHTKGRVRPLAERQRISASLKRRAAHLK